MLIPSWQVCFIYIVQSSNALNYLEKTQKYDLMVTFFKIKRLLSQLNSSEEGKILKC